MLDSTQLHHFIMVNTIGTSILMQAFKDASYLLSKTNGYTKYGSACTDALIFVQGTGLEMVLTQYSLAYNADKLRSTFFTLMDHRELIS